MRVALAMLGAAFIVSSNPTPSLPVASPNPNTDAAGTTRDGVVSLTLEARRVMWFPDGDSLPGRETTAFAEPGKSPVIPGPLIRVPAGTEVRLTVRNTDVPDTLRFEVPGLTQQPGAARPDSVVIPPGGTGELRFTARTPGNFFYRAAGTDVLSQALQIHGLLAGAVVVDSVGATIRPDERVLVLLWSIDSAAAGRPVLERSIFAINGLSWPHTERITATVGDSLRWRIINLNADVHPVHLHGFYFRVDEYASVLPPRDGQERAGRMVVTERMPGFSRMTITWVPERAGNWLAHCHFALHLVPPRLLQSPSLAALAGEGAHASHAADGSSNHATMGMAGLVMGVTVRPRPGERIAEPEPGRRQLRLVAVQDPGFPDTLPSLRFRLEARGGAVTEAGPGFSPPIVLARGEPVSITVVNTLREPTAVHWHGIELESYYDGVAGFGGSDGRVTPIIAPRDSFEVRFTPPRAGTFIYHSHVNEIRQHAAGLVGSLVVLDRAREMGADDHVFFMKATRTTPVDGAML
ncbi:MAG TPA: multicopper oxidase domain-containing protein [Gemmatimonadaceae bacterium]|nr:multicopper oxidase domain-containing protein [Gemmatimonadaceae bacterium]